MFDKKLLLPILGLAVIAMACSFNIELPQVQIETGPTVTEEINVESFSDEEVANVALVFGAGRMAIQPGQGPELLTGTLTYNVPALKPDLSVTESEIRLSQGSLEINGLPNFDGLINDWRLEIGPDPLRLEINAGAYEGDYEMGGLALHDLRVIDGAASTRMRFSEPNPVEMGTLRYDTGASQVRLTDLGNANFERMIFKGGAGDFTLDFSGDLQRDARVTIDSGLSSLKIIVPAAVNAEVFIDSGLASTSTRGGWRQTSSGFRLSGNGPTLTIEIELGAGSLDLTTS